MRLLLLSCICLLSAGKSLAQPALPEVPKNAQWIFGPVVTPLGDLADIKVPDAFRFTDAVGAKFILDQMKNPIPKGLMGIVTPNAGGWWVILQFSEVGYVPEEGAAAMDPEAILASMQERVDVQNAERANTGLAPVDKLEWAIKPTYDPGTKTLEWAVKAQAGPDAVLNHTVRVLSRRGVLDAIAVRPFRANTDVSEVKKLMEQVKFNQGQQYADYKTGDKIAKKTMAELIVANDTTETKTAGGWMNSIWVAIGAVLLLVCFVAAGSTVIVKKLRAKGTPAPTIEPAVTAAPEPKPAAQEAAAAPTQPHRQVLLKTRTANFKARPAVNGNAAAIRRRGFDYNRYFTDLMANVYSGSYGVDVQPFSNGEEVNGQSYGVGLPVNGKAPAVNGFGDADIVAAQKSLIEEQRRLIQEQSKLIEEKSKIIEEKNKILRIQSELMDHKLI